jgi:hypothetical protein
MGGEPFDPVAMEKAFQSSGDVHGEKDHVQSTDVSRSVDVPAGVWTDVRAGQVTAEGTVTRPEWPGLLFLADDPTKVVVWHLKPSVFVCNRRNIRPEQVVFEEGTHAPFCPTCLSKKKQLAKKSKVKGRRKQRHMIERFKAEQAAKYIEKQPNSEIVWKEQNEGG